MKDQTQFLTFGIAALRCGVQAHTLDRLAKLGRIPFVSAGRYRLVAIADLPAIRHTQIEHGYSPVTEDSLASVS